MSYKYCIVPKCTNTTIKTPEKLFLHVPSDEKIRKKWCKLMKRDDKTPLSTKTSLYCCEDHFDLETDLENYVKFKLVGGRLKLKKGVTPHKFECQKTIKNKIERPGFKKRRDIEYFERVLSKNVEHENLLTSVAEFNDREEHHTMPLFAPDNTEEVSDKKKQKNRAVQVHITKPTKDKNTNTPHKWKAIRNKQFPNPKQTDHTIDTVSLTTFSTNSLKSTDAESESTEIIKVMNENSFKSHMQKGDLMAISRKPKLFIGIPQHSQFCLEHLQRYSRLPLLEILVTLRKIRWHEPNSMLAVHFGISESSVCKYITNAIPKIACCMKELITFPEANDIRQNLPIPFRRRYSKVTSIIDCFEVQIEKPSDATHQASTWSQYKNCNTIKFLISVTPDGLINFISEGYGGRTSDSAIFEDCEILEKLTEGSLVLADRGFKNISHLLEQNGCTLVRPPSVSSDCKPTKEEVLQTKKIAALRVHVERSIGRLRDFEMIGPHSTVNIHHICLLDDVVVIASGIVNLQDCLFNQRLNKTSFLKSYVPLI